MHDKVLTDLCRKSPIRRATMSPEAGKDLPKIISGVSLLEYLKRSSDLRWRRIKGSRSLFCTSNKVGRQSLHVVELC